MLPRPQSTCLQSLQSKPLRGHLVWRGCSCHLIEAAVVPVGHPVPAADQPAPGAAEGPGPVPAVPAEPPRRKVSARGNLSTQYYGLLDEFPKNALPNKRPLGQHQYTLQYTCRMSIEVNLKGRSFRLKCKDWAEQAVFHFDINGGVGYAFAQAEAKLGMWQGYWRGSTPAVPLPAAPAAAAIRNGEVAHADEDEAREGDDEGDESAVV